MIIPGKVVYQSVSDVSATPSPFSAAISSGFMPIESCRQQEALSRIHAYLLNSDGVLVFEAPLLIGGAVGAIAGLLRWHWLEPATRRLLALAIGWFLAGFGLLMLVPYAPSRYVIPALPPLALMIGVGGQAVSGWRPRATWLRPIAAASLTVALSVPGLLSYQGEIAGAPTTIPSVQAQVAAVVPPEAVVEGGYAPLFAMRTSGPTIFTLFGINAGDLYAQRGVRWLVVEQGEVPGWAAQHPVPWAARRLILSTRWGGHRVELYQLP